MQQRLWALGPGMIFSGSAVVDENGTAGFGENAVVAIYTSAGTRQTQSIAYSTDGFKFEKYNKNPVLVSHRPDFRDPKVIWHEETSAWIMAISAGNAMEFYRSTDLKNWEFASRFGEGAGNHGGVWECPDLFPLEYDGNNKLMLISSFSRNSSSPLILFAIIKGYARKIKNEYIEPNTRGIDKNKKIVADIARMCDN